jgi:hypothetical protein
MNKKEEMEVLIQLVTHGTITKEEFMTKCDELDKKHQQLIDAINHCFPIAI